MIGLKFLFILLVMNSQSIALTIGEDVEINGKDYEELVLESLSSSLDSKNKDSIKITPSQTVIGLGIETKAGFWSWNKGISSSIEFHLFPQGNK